MNGEPNHVISFAGFELDPEHRRLTRDGKTLRLNAKAFDLLVYLAANAGRIVTKEEILDAVWENQFVEEGNLKVQMFALRKVLGEQKDDHRFLVTVPGRGYKFVADIRSREPEIVIESRRYSRLVVEETPAADSPQETDAQRSNFRLLAFGAVMLIAVLLVGGFLFLNRAEKNVATPTALSADAHSTA